MSREPRPSGALVAAIVQLDKATLCNLLGISQRTLENMIKAGTFPPPVRIGKYCYWTEMSVRRWQQRQFCVQENWEQGK